MNEIMSKTSPLSLYKFFLVVPLSFEDLAQKELQLKWQDWQILLNQQFDLPSLPLPPLQKVVGGIELELPLPQGLLLNILLKIPTRILLRIAEFKCRDFPKLFNKIKKIPWPPYLCGQVPQVLSSSHESRIFDSRKIAKTVQEGIQAFYQANPPKKILLDSLPDLPSTSVYLRFHQDQVVLSLDTSGEKLYKRLQRTHVGQAPLRENLAAGLILHLMTKVPMKFADDDHHHPPALIDPMTGSGSFLIEARGFYDLSLQRDYSFLHFPCFRPYKKAFHDFKNREESPAHNPFFLQYIGLDLDQKILREARKNSTSLLAPIEFFTHDLFSHSPLPPTIPTGHDSHHPPWMILNPPYGKRLSLSNASLPQKYFEDLMLQITQKFHPQVLALILPAEVPWEKIPLPTSYQKQSLLKFSNGGLKVHFLTLKKKT